MWCKRLEDGPFADAAVVAKSRKFVWVEVNRDRTPEIPKHYNVSAYPTLLFLDPEDEKIYRFQAFHETPVILDHLSEALRRFALYRAGQVWDEPTPRPPSICDTAQVRTLPAPSEAVPAGVVPFGNDLFVGQIGKLYRIDRKTGAVKDEFALPSGVIDLATDGKLLYALTGGWTAGLPIFVIDPGTGKTLREIVTEANRKNRAYGAKGIAFRDGSLWVLEGMGGILDEVDPESGEVKSRVQTGEHWLAGLAFDGTNFVTGSRDHVYYVPPTGGKPVRSVAVNYPVRSVAAADGAIFVMEQPIFGFDRHHRRIRVWPVKSVIHRMVPSEESKTK